jgi:hypothetical protein
VAVTPEVDKYTSMFSSLGDRFVMVRWKRVGGIDAAIRAMHQDDAAKDADMRQAVAALFNAIEDAPEPTIPMHIERCIAALAELIAIGRTPIRRERDEEIEYVPEAEGATRLAKQFCQLAKGSARLELRTEVDSIIDLGVVHRVAFDTLPPNRATVLRSLLEGRSVATCELKRHARQRAIDDLKELDLLDNDGKFTRTARSLLATAGLLKM